jgi:hypothetical protein
MSSPRLDNFEGFGAVEIRAGRQAYWAKDETFHN